MNVRTAVLSCSFARLPGILHLQQRGRDGPREGTSCARSPCIRRSCKASLVSLTPTSSSFRHLRRSSCQSPIYSKPKEREISRLGQTLKWSMECQAAFEKLKQLFAVEPVLKHPNPNKLFVIQADVSDITVHAVLLQKIQQGLLQPCAYTSKKLSNTECRWGIWEKEAYAVLWTLLTWRQERE